MGKYFVGSALILVIFITFFTMQFTTQKDPNQSKIVLAFTDSAIKNESNWSDKGFALQIVSNCLIQDKSCVSNYLQSTVNVANKLHTPLVIIAQSGYASAVISSLDNTHKDQAIDAIVFLQAEMVGEISTQWQAEKTLVINSAQDTAETVSMGRRLAKRLRENGTSWFTMLIPNEKNNLMLHPILPDMIGYLLDNSLDSINALEFRAEKIWQQPLFDNKAFYQDLGLIKKLPFDESLYRTLQAFYSHEPYLLKQWPLKTYQAFDLLQYRSQLPEEQQGRFASFMNRKGHRFYLDLERYAQYEPEFVIGIDDETNLYRLTSFYRTRRFNSWEQGGPNEDMLYSQSLGAFIHFRMPVPRIYELPYLQYSSILFESISFSNQDPYENFRSLSKSSFSVLTLNCLPCHSIGSIGGAAHHIDFQTGEPQPGYALPLTSYPIEVLQNFFFNQRATADLIGVNPNYVERGVAEELLEWIPSIR